MTSADKIAAMRAGGKKLARIKKKLARHIKPGQSLATIDSLAETLIQQAGGEPSFQAVPRYHWATCINLNQGVVHGIPHAHITINPGDLVSFDLGFFYRGFHTDTATTVPVGPIKAPQKKFLAVGQKALKQAISQARAGNQIGHISQAMQTVIESAGYQSVRTLSGHGIGKKLHQFPPVPCFLNQPINQTPKLTAGMALAIEAIYTEKSFRLKTLADGWTIETQDQSLGGLFEETVLITKTKAEILTNF